MTMHYFTLEATLYYINSLLVTVMYACIVEHGNPIADCESIKNPEAG